MRIRMKRSSSSERRYSPLIILAFQDRSNRISQAFNLDVPKSMEERIVSPIEKNLSPLAENVVKRAGGFASLVTKALQSNPNAEAPHVKARREAEAADQEYKTAVRNLDRQRLGLEERIEDTLKKLQQWEIDRLRAVKTGKYKFNCNGRM